MTEKVTIYGLTIELDEIDQDAVITDVMIIYRTVHPSDYSDGVGLIPSDNLSGVVQSGMLAIAAERDLKKWDQKEGEHLD